MRQFYNPELSESEIEELDWANWLVLMAGQALFGAIGTNTIAVALDVGSRSKVQMHWWLGADDQVDREEARDAADEMDIYTDGRVEVEAVIHVGERPRIGEWGQDRRLVFLRRIDSDRVGESVV